VLAFFPLSGPVLPSTKKLRPLKMTDGLSSFFARWTNLFDSSFYCFRQSFSSFLFRFFKDVRHLQGVLLLLRPTFPHRRGRCYPVEESANFPPSFNNTDDPEEFTVVFFSFRVTISLTNPRCCSPITPNRQWKGSTESHLSL